MNNNDQTALTASTISPAYYIILIGIMSELSAIVCACIGFGDAILFYMMFKISKLFFPEVIASIPALQGNNGESELHYVAVLLGVRAMITFGFQAYLTREFIQWRLLKPAAPVFLVFALVGCITLDKVGNDPSAKTAQKYIHWFLGVVFSLFALLHTIGVYVVQANRNKPKPVVEAPPKPKEGEVEETNTTPTEKAEEEVIVIPASPASPLEPKTEEEKRAYEAFMDRVRIGLFFAAIPSGFLGGAITVGAPPLAILALFQGWPKNLARGMLPFSLEIIFIVRNVYDIVVDNFIKSHDSSSSSLGFSYFRPDYLAMITAGMVGTLCGNEIGMIVPEATYKRLVVFLLFLAGMTLGDFVSEFLLIIVVLLFSLVEVVRYYLNV